MAIDTEAKRWSMLQLANGPSAYSHVINPSGSDFDSQVERLTLLKVYGGDLAADTTAPVLTNATGAADGSTGFTGTVDTTNDANGTLYYWVTENASETLANIKANGSTQAVTAEGTQNVSGSGLSAETTYYIHYVHTDAASNDSNVESSSAFTTAETEDIASGGFWDGFARELERRRKERLKRLKRKRKAKKLAAQIAAKLDRELFLAERKLEDDEAEDSARKAELARVNRLVASNQDVIMAMNNERLTFVMAEALEKQTFSTIERMERELKRMREEEEFLMLATKIIMEAS